MKKIGLIAEYNPFHNGHLYQINKIKEMYPDSMIILVLNGYFLERGIPSIETKEEKTKLALEYGIDLVVELPFVFGSNSADIFASTSIDILSELKIDTLIFGSESNDLDKLYESAKLQLDAFFDIEVKKYLDEGYNYPTALNKATKLDIKEPNDLLGISYIKAILKNNYNINVELIQRTNDYHDITSDKEIVSASNIREKLNNNMDIKKYIPSGNLVNINEDKIFKLLKYKIITDDDLSKYLTVDEGIEYRLIDKINKVDSLQQLIESVKTKRYTYNRINRMLTHILIGLTKEDKEELSKIEYIKILGFNNIGQKYLSELDTDIPVTTSLKNMESKIKKYELKAAHIYEIITQVDVTSFEYKNKPIIKD